LIARNQIDEAMVHYEKSFSIFKELAVLDPTNKGWQRDLSVLYDRIGDELLDHGNTDGASKFYLEGFSISRRLVDSDPENLTWQWYLAISYGKRGNILFRQNRPNEALDSYQSTLSIFKRPIYCKGAFRSRSMIATDPFALLSLL
jgi:tetratricopeptide (TPR) repeat protein